jgi:hypothetical protein
MHLCANARQWRICAIFYGLQPAAPIGKGCGEEGELEEKEEEEKEEEDWWLLDQLRLRRTC